MILYNVTVKIDLDIEDTWLAWVKENFIRKILDTNLFIDSKIFKLLNESDNDGVTYALQFYANSITEIDIFLNNYVQSIAEEHRQLFKNKHVAFMTLLEEID